MSFIVWPFSPTQRENTLYSSYIIDISASWSWTGKVAPDQHLFLFPITRAYAWILGGTIDSLFLKLLFFVLWEVFLGMISEIKSHFLSRLLSLLPLYSYSHWIYQGAHTFWAVWTTFLNRYTIVFSQNNQSWWVFKSRNIILPLRFWLSLLCQNLPKTDDNKPNYLSSGKLNKWDKLDMQMGTDFLVPDGAFSRCIINSCIKGIDGSNMFFSLHCRMPRPCFNCFSGPVFLSADSQYGAQDKNFDAWLSLWPCKLYYSIWWKAQ